jgi:hypothetical protein
MIAGGIMSRSYWAACLIATALLQTAVRAQSTSRPSSDPIQPDTVWTGQEVGDARTPRRSGNNSAYAEARITSRQGELFRFEYSVFRGGVWHKLEMQGQIRRNEVRAQAVQVMPGGVWQANILEVIWEGHLDGENLKLERRLPSNQIITTDVKLDPNGGRDGRRGQRGRGS